MNNGRPSRLTFWLFFIGLLFIIIGNMMEYYATGTDIGPALQILGFLIWIVLIIITFVMRRKER